ncbi:MAG: hypothetical protein KatS3mg118_0064 [Paracoccaceae bacterium]|nr:MAG: hypothetical protein KatS3mg118_0064 [Paracoccaceae bacterium]
MCVQPGHDELGDAVVEHALALDHLLASCALPAVASSLKCWISVPGSGSLVEDLRLALVDQSAAGHVECPPSGSNVGAVRRAGTPLPDGTVSRSGSCGAELQGRPAVASDRSALWQGARAGLSGWAQRSMTGDADEHDLRRARARLREEVRPRPARCSSRPSARRNRLLGLWAAGAARPERARRPNAYAMSPWCSGGPRGEVGEEDVFRKVKGGSRGEGRAGVGGGDPAARCVELLRGGQGAGDGRGLNAAARPGGGASAGGRSSLSPGHLRAGRNARAQAGPGFAPWQHVERFFLRLPERNLEAAGFFQRDRSEGSLGWNQLGSRSSCMPFWLW